MVGTFRDRISVKHEHLHTREIIGEVDCRSDAGNRIIIDSLTNRAEQFLAGLEQILAVFEIPGALVAAAQDFLLHGAQDSIAIGEGGEKQIFFPHGVKITKKNRSAAKGSRKEGPGG